MILGATACEISSNARILDYPCASSVLQVANSSIFRAPGWEARERPYLVPSKGQGKDPERAAISSKYRAKREVRDIAMCNRFDWFMTWTLDGNIIDRYGVEGIRKAVLTWLKNASYRKNFQYLIIAERHKDGAIHFHGLCNLGDVRIVQATNPHSGQPIYTKNGQPVYNMQDWKYGFSTCIPIDGNYERTCNYLTKYFEKDFSKIFGKWYFSSRDLVRRPQITLIDGGVPYEEFVTDNPDAYIIPVYNDVKIAGKPLAAFDDGGSI